GESELVEDVLVDRARVAEVVYRHHVVILVALEQYAMQLVSSRFDLNIDGCAPCRTLLRVESIGADVNCLNRLGWRHLRDIDRQPRVGDRGAVQLGTISGRGDAVHKQRLSALRIAGVGIGLQRGRYARARYQVKKALKILALAAVVRQFFDLLG